jgi:hypothetical protein
MLSLTGCSQKGPKFLYFRSIAEAIIGAMLIASQEDHELELPIGQVLPNQCLEAKFAHENSKKKAVP